MKYLLDPNGLSQKGYAVIRMITGTLLVYHGFEVFSQPTMEPYGKWLAELNFPLPSLMAYLGKGLELVCGICFIAGIFMRIASVFLILTMGGIAFGMGHGKIFTDDQHPFLFILIAFIYLFNGPGPWSLDSTFFRKA